MIRRCAGASTSPNRVGRPFFRRALRILISLGYLYFACAYFGPDDPFKTNRYYEIAWYGAFLARTFDFHAGLAFLAIALAAAVIRRWRAAIAATPLLLIGVGPTIWEYRLRESADSRTNSLRVMSVNLLWVNENTQPILDEILAESPDVLLLQEYTPTWHRAVQTKLGTSYSYATLHLIPGAFGAAIYSKYPLSEGVRSPGDSFEDRSPFLRAVLDIQGRNVSVYCVHLVPPTWANFGLMRRQFKILHEELTKTAGPLIVGGDFNFTGNASMDNCLELIGLTDAHAAAGYGRGATFKLRLLPDIRIDHIYMSAGLTPVACRTGIGRDSDHRPVIVDFRFK